MFLKWSPDAIVSGCLHDVSLSSIKFSKLHYDLPPVIEKGNKAAASSPDFVPVSVPRATSYGACSCLFTSSLVSKNKQIPCAILDHPRRPNSESLTMADESSALSWHFPCYGSRVS
ncbi:hypothetical protein AXF42_Ash008877 [Apostasia shenzhenica]|uniref:Uncharacterized protein n=1 Tax=Apostasia shenzhenica TaxID=1088818 RepID=A0A2I0ASR8_9ASPA|nr:hypothetical protein AXF42_Ash008877 [Apostasia shenzhenica]